MVALFERMSKSGRRIARLLAAAAAAAVLVVAGAALTPSALAGQYHVYSCRTPSGESAPADGWSGSLP